MQTYSIKKVCQITGINPNTLRTWERRYRLITPKRTESGRRQYDQDDIEVIRLLAQLVFEGHTISNLKGLSKGELESRLSTQTTKLKPIYTPSDSFNKTKIQTQTNHILTKLLDALEIFDLRQVTKLISQCRYRLDPRDFALEMISPLLGDIGKRVDQGILGVAQEHAISSILKFELMKLLMDLRIKVKAEANSVMLVTQENDYHEFGILIASVIASLHGWNTHYIGPNMPIQATMYAANAINPNIIIISSIHLDPKKQRQFVDDLIYLSDRCQDQEIWVGGNLNFDLSRLRDHSKIEVLNNFQTLDGLLTSYDKKQK